MSAGTILIVEPWGDQFMVPSNGQVEISMKSEVDLGLIEIEQTTSGLTLYCPEGCLVTVSSNGIELQPVGQN